MASAQTTAYAELNGPLENCAQGIKRDEEPTVLDEWAGKETVMVIYLTSETEIKDKIASCQKDLNVTSINHHSFFTFLFALAFQVNIFIWITNFWTTIANLVA